MLDMKQMLSYSQVVVIGREVSNITIFESINTNLEVHCVLKSDGYHVFENITIFSVFPVSKCSGTAGSYKQGDLIMVGLRRIGNHTFQWDEHVPITSVAFHVTVDNLVEISKVCGLQTWIKPVGAVVDKCPVCSSDATFESQNYSNNVTCFSDRNRSECTNIPRIEMKSKCSCARQTVSVGDNGGTAPGITTTILYYQ
ncbi:unnamed protein product [Mytilus coruscus]|uniref:Uncharacterized protein n=1 Tax=Mytilus coruscus TaxID=42192 RepID=A0A6J8DBH5_MYTCO|nr:unnamed protein product [Mytilus coruscus]